ncbi:MAG: CDP-alcohol phosphatidyltransferase family protein [Candidatus Lokiarchaeota archaeon]|nr:CDP-alcohol phosphatidyltransferase family protein [Candidatus Lokiarchaeota archaeon]
MSKIVNLLKLKDYITLTGTTLGLIAVLLVTLGGRGYVSLGFFLLAFTIGTDLLDGFIARKTGTINEIGKQLDSLNDSLTFGIAPAILMFQGFRRVVDTLEPYDYFLLIACIIFALCAILRLARFNISDVPGYTGVPTPMSALLMINLFYANYFFAIFEGGGGYQAYDIAFPFFSYILLPIIMIFLGWSNITTSIKFGEKDKKIYIYFIVLAPLCPIFGIIGILNPTIILAIIVSSIFFGFVIIEVGYIIVGIVRSHINKKSS